MGGTRLRTVQGIVIRLSDPCLDEYVVLWSPEFNHSFIYRDDITDEDTFMDANPGVWMEFDVDDTLVAGPEEIATRAYNLHFVPPGRSRDPSTKADEEYNNVHEFRNCSLFECVQKTKTIRYKERFRLSNSNSRQYADTARYGCAAAEGKFVRLARLAHSDERDLLRYNEYEFTAVVDLDIVAAPDHPCPWKITHFIHMGKEYSLNGYLSLRGKILRGRGGDPLPREKATVPVDALRLAEKSSTPSVFSTRYQGDIDLTATSQQAPLSNNQSNIAARVPNATARNVDAPVPRALRIPEIEQEMLTFHGIVVYCDGQKGWYVLSLACRTDFIHFEQSVPLQTGSWFRFDYCGGASLPNRPIAYSEVRYVVVEGPPRTQVYTRFIPSQTYPQYNGDVLIALRARVCASPNDFYFASEYLGELYDHDKVLPLNEIAKAQFNEVILEVIPSRNGWQIVRYHGLGSSLNQLDQLRDPWIPYTVQTSEAANQLREERQRREQAEQNMAREKQLLMEREENARRQAEMCRKQQEMERRRLEEEAVEAELQRQRQAQLMEQERADAFLRSEMTKKAKADAARKLAEQEAAQRRRLEEREIERRRHEDEQKMLVQKQLEEQRRQEEAYRRRQLVEEQERRELEKEQIRMAEEQRQRDLKEKATQEQRRTLAAATAAAEARKEKEARAEAAKRAAVEDEERRAAIALQKERERRAARQKEERERERLLHDIEEQERQTNRHKPSVGENASGSPSVDRRSRVSTSTSFVTALDHSGESRDDTDIDIKWKRTDLSKERTTGRDPEAVKGVIVRVYDDCVVLFVPMRGCHKVIVRKDDLRGSFFEREGGELKVGVWMDVPCVEPRLAKDQEDLPEPFTHLCVVREESHKPSLFNIYDEISDWQQRIRHKVFEIYVSCDLSERSNIIRHDSEQDYSYVYELDCDYFIPVIVPSARLEKIIDPTTLVAPCTIQFWATRLQAGALNVPLHLVNSNSITKISLDGTAEIIGFESHVERLNCADSRDDVKDATLDKEVQAITTKIASHATVKSKPAPLMLEEQNGMSPRASTELDPPRACSTPLEKDVREREVYKQTMDQNEVYPEAVDPPSNSSSPLPHDCTSSPAVAAVSNGIARCHVDEDDEDANLRALLQAIDFRDHKIVQNALRENGLGQSAELLEQWRREESAKLSPKK